MSSLRIVAAITLIAIIGAITVVEINGQPAFPGRPCRIKPLKGWTNQECLVWSRVCEGKEIDFSSEPGYGGEIDPKEADGWRDNRILTSRFLETILLHEPYRSAQTRRGVRILGAWFKEEIELKGAELHRELWLERSRLEMGADLGRLRTQSLLSFEGSTVAGRLDLDNIQVEESLYLSRASFDQLSLIGAQVGGLLVMSGSTVTNRLSMDSAQIGRSLFINNGAILNEVWMRGARIGGQLNLIESTVQDSLIMNSVKVGEHILLRSANLKAAKLDMVFLSVDGNLDLCGAALKEVDMQGAAIGGGLHMASPDSEAVWEPGSILDLRQATAGSLGARISEPGPGAVRLAGFRYGRLGTFGGEERMSVEETVAFVENWLSKEQYHSPEAHEQFARVLRQMGYFDQAQKTLYDSGNHQFRQELENRKLLNVFWLAALWAFIGYGHVPWHAFWWILGLTLLGWCMARYSGVRIEGDDKPLGLWFSVDRLLPIIELRKKHYEVDLGRTERIYFYIHTIAGYVLATFLLAAVSGLVG